MLQVNGGLLRVEEELFIRLKALYRLRVGLKDK